MQMGGRMPAEDDARLAQRLQEEFNSSSGSRPKRSAASEAKKRLAEARFAPQLAPYPCLQHLLDLP